MRYFKLTPELENQLDTLLGYSLADLSFLGHLSDEAYATWLRTVGEENYREYAALTEQYRHGELTVDELKERLGSLVSRIREKIETDFYRQHSDEL